MPQYNTLRPTVWHFHIQIIRLLLEMNTIIINVLDGLFVWPSRLPHLEWRVADTTIGIFMMWVVMAVNSWIVPFHSPVVKAGCIGELQKATFTGQSLIIFTAYCWTADSHLTNHQFCPFIFLTRSQLKEENITPVAFFVKKTFFIFRNIILG